jgi:hypothetical protein
MKRSEWSDHELEQLLREMPKIKDNRDPHDIYQSLSLKAKKKKRPVWIIPSAASIAAALLLFLLAPNIWQGIYNNNSAQAPKEEAQMAKSDDSDSRMMEKVSPDNQENLDIAGNQGITGMSVLATSETAIYEEDIVDQDIFTYWIPDQNASIIVPISIMVPKGNETWLEQYQAHTEKLTEAQWGLSDYYPLNANLTMTDNQTLNIDVPEGHSYGNGSASETEFFRVIKKFADMNKNIQHITLSTNGKPGMMFGNIGEVKDVDLRAEQGKSAYYLFTPNDSNTPFLVPSVNLYADIESAFNALKTNEEENYGLKTPLSFDFEITSSEKPNLVITLKEDVSFTNEPKYIYAIESILLTAKEFGYETVKFEGTAAQQVGRFNLQNELKVPVAANKVYLQ